MKKSIVTLLALAAFFMNAGHALAMGVLVLNPGSDSFEIKVGPGSFTYSMMLDVTSDANVSIKLDGFERIKGSSLAFTLFDVTNNTLVGSGSNSHKLITAFLNGSDAYRLDITGDIMGRGNRPKFGSVEFETHVSPVPEPETWGMMLVGLGLLGRQLRKKQTT